MTIVSDSTDARILSGTIAAPVRKSLAHSVPSAMMAAAAVVVFTLSVVRVFFFGATQSNLDQVSGTWAALAVDLASGVFYRPIVGPDGFGGTRYFPLFFMLHAAAIKVFGHPVLMGQILAALPVCALLVGVYVLLRAIGAGRLLAGSGAMAVLVSRATQIALVSIREDGLAAALNLIGFALCVQPAANRRRALGAAALFTLAFAAKGTSIFGVCAAVLWLLWSKRGRLAFTVTAATAIGAIAVISLMQFASGGRAFEVLWAGSATGVHVSDFVNAPVRFGYNLRGSRETAGFILLGVGAALAFAIRQRSITNLPMLFFATTLLGTVPIFAFEGTGPNHLIDVHVASIVAIGGYITSRREKAGLSVAVLALAMLMGSLSLTTGLIGRDPARGRGTFDQALALIPDAQRPILADNPLVPIAAHQRPYMLDAYMFRMMTDQHPGFDAPLMQALSQHAFSAVVLERDPSTEPGRSLYRDSYFGGRFGEVLDRYYERTGAVGRRTVLTPRQQ